MKYKIKEIHKGIFLVEFEKQYDLAMTFLRFQEFYESANPKFKGKGFTILEYMDWYSNERPGCNGTFTYPTDWAGFNVPLWVAGGTGPISDFNIYDQTMKDIINKIEKKHGNLDKKYILGTTKGNAKVLRHEIAHGLYYVYNFYKLDMDRLYSKLPKEVKSKLENEFKKMGYHKSVWKDEAQAYISTGVSFKAPWLTEEMKKPFKQLYRKFTKDIKIK